MRSDGEGELSLEWEFVPDEGLRDGDGENIVLDEPVLSNHRARRIRATTVLQQNIARNLLILVTIPGWRQHSDCREDIGLMLAFGL